MKMGIGAPILHTEPRADGASGRAFISIVIALACIPDLIIDKTTAKPYFYE
jgi:hypothetical protein